MKYFKKINLIILLTTIVLQTGCESVTDSDTVSTSGEWLIPKEEVFDGGPGRDGIPAINSPNFDSEALHMTNGDLVIAIKIDDEIHVYSHDLLDYHEIVNDKIGDHAFAVTYCPLTGSGIAWNRKINGTETTFGVSGLLYNTNLIPYDRLTSSNWSQMRNQSVNGELITKEAETYHVIETRWGTLKQIKGNVKIVSRNTGFDFPYDRYPYNDYKSNHNFLLFPVDNDDERLPRKTRVLGLDVNNQQIAFTFDTFADETTVLNENINGRSVVIAGSSKEDYIVAYHAELSNNVVPEFSAVENEFPVIMTDNLGNKWNIFGEAVEGPNERERLIGTESYMAYWFAWAAFNPETVIY